jgi:hypothetical protein
MQWKIGMVPAPVLKDARMSAQDMRTAQVATYIHERAEEQRELALREAQQKQSLATTPTPNPSPTQVGLARLAQDMVEPGQARVPWGRGTGGAC